MIEKKIEAMRKGGRILGDLLDREILCRILEGVSTLKIDSFIEQFIKDNGAEPILKGYVADGKRYDHSSCISINEQVVHAPPSPMRIISSGDMVTVDVCLRYDGYCVDAARTFIIGGSSSLKHDLINTAILSFKAGFEQFKIGNKIGDVSQAVQSVIEREGFKVIKDFCGHSIGRTVHEDISVCNYGYSTQEIYEGLAIALEPMLSENDEYTYIGPDGWSAYTSGMSAHYEDTIIATKLGPENLTSRVFNG